MFDFLMLLREGVVKSFSWCPLFPPAATRTAERDREEKSRQVAELN